MREFFLLPPSLLPLFFFQPPLSLHIRPPPASSVLCPYVEKTPSLSLFRPVCIGASAKFLSGDSWRSHSKSGKGRAPADENVRENSNSTRIPPTLCRDPLQSLVCAAQRLWGRKRDRGGKRREGGWEWGALRFPMRSSRKRREGTCVQGGFFQSIPSERSQPPLALLFCRDFFRKRAVLQFTLAWGRGFFCGGESRSIPIKDSKHSSFP